jgi:hypothetical protein
MNRRFPSPFFFWHYILTSKCPDYVSREKTGINSKADERESQTEAAPIRSARSKLATRDQNSQILIPQTVGSKRGRIHLHSHPFHLIQFSFIHHHSVLCLFIHSFISLLLWSREKLNNPKSEVSRKLNFTVFFKTAKKKKTILD